MANLDFIHQTIQNNRQLAQDKRRQADEMEQQASQKRDEAQEASKQKRQDLIDLVVFDYNSRAESIYDAQQARSELRDQKQYEREAANLQQQADQLRREADQAEHEANDLEQKIKIAEKGGPGSDDAAARAESEARDAVSTKEGTGGLF